MLITEPLYKMNMPLPYDVISLPYEYILHSLSIILKNVYVLAGSSLTEMSMVIFHIKVKVSWRREEQCVNVLLGTDGDSSVLNSTFRSAI